jgi:hypothetical protein
LGSKEKLAETQILFWVIPQTSEASMSKKNISLVVYMYQFQTREVVLCKRKLPPGTQRGDSSSRYKKRKEKEREKKGGGHLLDSLRS